MDDVRDEPCRLPAHVLADRIRRREVTATAVFEAHADRIRRVNPALNAVVSADLERAADDAAAADRALAEGRPVGPLHGVPMTLKDCHDVAGMRTTIGTPVFDAVPEADGTVAARLRAAGAIIVGHSNVPPFLAGYRSDNPIFGRTANPWDPGRTPGGSSGGAAAGVAAGLTPVEVGSDLAGSLRLPPHFCGVYGLKCTERRIPLTGFYRSPDGGPNPVRVLGALGPIARDVDDLGLLLRILSGPDGRDGDVPPVPPGDRAAVDLAGLRLAWAETLPVPGATPSAELRAQVRRVADGAAAAGARVTGRLPDVDWSGLTLFGELMTATVGAFNPAMELPAERRELAWYLTALGRRDRFMTAWHDLFRDVDALLLPPALTTAFRHDDSTPEDGHGLMSVPANLAGLPALTVPAGRDADGLPVGVQIVGPAWSETRLLDIAAALEAAGVLPGFTAPPGP